MDNYLILTEDEFHSVDPRGQIEGLVGLSTDNRTPVNVLIAFDTIPDDFSSKTVYTRAQVDAMLRDTSGEFYTPGY